ncbi:minor head protein inhibitor of protease [Enterobacteria phage vB_EcoM_IME341]|uniref:Inhibitor of prohead protease n=1 Tax=Enterobacteria phage vB_EcoM_IME341 TaxID=2163891 RepID=A0A2S1GRL9_9CAUD|nr:minor head protein inhibitor of protease [Enterobacteria phage vB_EcoM_IME341]AWD92019.1 inhibitor of prohead protease [Enterobacteria phage vB_EcoM_IME341]
MDHQYIEELRALEDKKEAKAKLIEYGEQFGLKLKKTRSFDNLIIDITEGLKALADEPLPETEGLSISDLIDAADELTGSNEFIDGAEPAKEEATLLFDAPEAVVEVVEVVELPKVEVIEEDVPFDEEKFKEAVDKVVELEKPVFSLPENFSPNLLLIGKNPGYCTVPWWIYQWISETPDWKERPTAFQHPTAHQTLFSLIYYINRNGSVLIRETRNSSFVTLK